MRSESELLPLAQRTYALGRAKTVLLRALLATAVLGSLAFAELGVRAWYFIPLTFATLFFTEWWGTELMHGARRGVLAGIASLLLPLSILRPCCDPFATMSADCCTMPEMCWLSGGVMGLTLALFIPRMNAARRARFALGMTLGALAVAGERCVSLFAGEALGLLGGLALGVVVMSSVRGWLDRGLVSTAR